MKYGQTSSNAACLELMNKLMKVLWDTYELPIAVNILSRNRDSISFIICSLCFLALSCKQNTFSPFITGHKFHGLNYSVQTTNCLRLFSFSASNCCSLSSASFSILRRNPCAISILSGLGVSENYKTQFQRDVDKLRLNLIVDSINQP